MVVFFGRSKVLGWLRPGPGGPGSSITAEACRKTFLVLTPGCGATPSLIDPGAGVSLGTVFSWNLCFDIVFAEGVTSPLFSLAADYVQLCSGAIRPLTSCVSPSVLSPAPYKGGPLGCLLGSTFVP